jgi:hypothetical protein
MKRHTGIVQLALLTLPLSACAGGGMNSAGSVAGPISQPPPEAPRLVSVAIQKIAPLDRAGLTTGTYDTISITYDDRNGSKSSVIPKPDDVRLTIDSATKAYSLSMNVAGFPKQASFDLSKDILQDGIFETAFGYHAIVTSTFSDGSKTVFENDFLINGSSPFESPHFFIDARYKYLSFGGWSRDGDTPPDEDGHRAGQSLAFVQGIRTGPADIPISGTATYSTSSGNPGGHNFDLHADFAARTIGTELAYKFGDNDELGSLSAKGSGPITSNGDFVIPLKGDFFDGNHVASDPFTGTINGAFFGPQAAETGGIYQFFRGSTVWAAGSFGLTKNP